MQLICGGEVAEQELCLLLNRFSLVLGGCVEGGSSPAARCLVCDGGDEE